MAKRVSAEEKRVKLLGIFTKNAEPYTLKELEKVAPKEGVRGQVVKEVLDELLGDSLVEQEKVGINMLYWSFPSAAGQRKKIRLETLQKALLAKKRELHDLQSQIEAAQQGKEDSARRQQLMEQHAVLLEKHKELAAKKLVLRDNDPRIVKMIREEALKVNEACVRWTDNITVAKDYVRKMQGGSMTEKEVNQMFELPEELPYLDESDPQLFKC